MTSKIEKDSFFAGAVEAEKLIRADQQDLTKINAVLKFFQLRRHEMEKQKKTTVVDAFRLSMQKHKLTSAQVKLFYRLLSQYLFGLNREYEVDKAITPAVYHCGAFCTKNHLARVGNYFAVCTHYGEDIDVSKISQSIFWAIETNKEIDLIIEEIMEAIPIMDDLEAKMLEEVLAVSDDDDDEESEGKKKQQQKNGKRKRKSAKKAEKRIEAEANLDDDDSSASEGELGEKEEAELVKETEAQKKSKKEQKYEKACNLFGDIVIKLIKTISVNSIFTIVVSKFLATFNKIQSAKKRAATGKLKPAENASAGDKEAAADDGDDDADKNSHDGEENDDDDDNDNNENGDKPSNGSNSDEEDAPAEEKQKEKRARVAEPDLANIAETAAQMISSDAAFFPEATLAIEDNPT
jgi:hypothetical protein